MLTKCAIAIVVAALSERFLSAPRHGARGGGGRGKAHGMSWGGKGISRTPARVAAFQNRVALLKLARPTTTASTPGDGYIYSYRWDDRPSALAYARPASLLTKTGGR